MEGLLYQVALYLVAMVVAVPLAVRLGVGSVLGYLVAGIVIGPLLGLVGSTETQDLQHFAEFGVVMMLFLIGLELEPRALWAMRHRLVGLGGLQIGLSIGVIGLLGLALGLDWTMALTAGAILSLSSTAIVLQTLTEKRLLQTAGGRATFSVLLMQDIAVIPMLILLPLLALPGLHAGDALHDGEAASFVAGLPAWGVTLVTLGVIVGVVLAGHFLIRPLFRFVHAARLREINTALALMIVAVIAWAMLMVDMSPALGTFLAGVVLANSEFRHEIESDIAPFKGLLLGLFFITVGAGINFRLLMAEPVRLVALTLLLMAAKGVVLYFLGRAFGLRTRNQWLFTLGLAQAGEFGFVLVAFTAQQRILTAAVAQELMLIIALSMLLTPLFFILHDRIVARTADETKETAEDEIDDRQPIIIAGVGRFGQVVNRMVTSSGFRTTVIDNDVETVRLLRRFGFKGYVGDPTRPDLLKAAGIDEARVLVAAMDDREANLRLVEYARRIRPDLHIVARAYDREHVFRLYRAGADDIVREMFDSSLRVGRYVLEAVGLSKTEANELERLFFDLDRRSVRQLAEVWQPGIPVEKNEAYVTLARELNRELETALMARSPVAQAAAAQAGQAEAASTPQASPQATPRASPQGATRPSAPATARDGPGGRGGMPAPPEADPAPQT
ncbi:MAG: cation:proton antiporter [Rhodobacteraceae bacterium]|nr:cation:proton antiporter [Paracoccaceae bacterium]